MSRLFLAPAFAALVLVALPAPSGAQVAPEEPDPPSALDQAPDVAAELAAWRAEHGASWRARTDPRTGHVRFLFGGHVPADVAPRSDADFFVAAREHVAATEALHGVEPFTLADDAVTFLPLGLAGSTDKTTVQFRQELDGVPVLRGRVTVLFGPAGELLSVDVTGLPRLAGTRTRPTLGADAALELALAWFRADTGLAPTYVAGPRLAIEQELAGKVRVPALVWEVELLNDEPGFENEGYVYRVAATGAPRLVTRDPLVHAFDILGRVTSRVSPGLLPDLPGNVAQEEAAAYMRISTPVGTFFSDANGNFLIPGTDGPLTATFEYRGLYNDVDNAAGAEHTRTLSISAGNANVVMNPSAQASVTSQANAFHHINRLRDWTRAVNPADSKADFVAASNVNLNLTCNAVFNGVATNYYGAGDGCVNTAFSTIVLHEMGHWLNVRYGSGNGGDGFGEGNADVFAMYVTDNPVVGQNFCGTGCIIRTGTNTTQYCGDNSGGCYGQVHVDGQVLMGALWKVRSRLKSSLGAAQGGQAANVLFNAWMNAYNDGAIHSIIEEHWLTLDDDNGTIDDGTPNHPAIDGGFRDQGFPGFELAFFVFSDLNLVADTFDQAGPYGVRVDATPQFGNVAGASVRYTVSNGTVSSGPVQIAPLSPAGGSTWTGFVPGQPSPARVRYWVEFRDDLGNVAAYPDGAPDAAPEFVVGERTIVLFDDFESGDNGWTHALLAEQDDWQRQAPAGKSGASLGVPWGDPSSAFSGTRHWGNDLGPSGWNGAYKADVENYLRSPTFGLVGATLAQLSFQRWLTVEEAQFDQAEIRVNGTPLWQNPSGAHVLDKEWRQVRLDLSSFDGAPSVQLEWRLRTDGGLELGGWNIDDVEVSSVRPAPSGCLPATYGSPTPGSLGFVVLDTAGQPATIGNEDFVLQVKNAVPNTLVYVGLGVSQAAVPFGPGQQLIVPTDAAPFFADVFGQVQVPVPIPNDPNLAGKTMYAQALAGDPNGFPWFVSLTAGLAIPICQ